MAAHWVSATFTGYDGEGRAGILYEAADLVGGMQYLGIVDDCNYLTGLKGTGISPGSPKGSVMLPPQYAGKLITLNLCGGAIVPNVLLDTISVYVPPKEIVPDGQRVFHAAASPMRHITPWGAIGGVVMGDALVHTTACDYNHHIVWGPYETLPAGEYIATFQLKVPNNTSSNQAFLIDVTRDAGVIITSKGLKYTDFKAAMEWQTVSREFKLGAETKKMEYRVAPGVGHPLYVGTITRRKKPVEPPPECAQEIIIRFADDPEKVADMFYTIKGGTPNIPAKSATQFTIQCPANQTVRINVGVTEDTIDSFTDFYACTAEVLEVPLLVAAPPGEAYLSLTVVDHEDAPIEGATITVDGATGTTDASGTYKTTAVIGTELTVTVTKDGYEPGTLTDTMPEGGLPIKIMLVKIGELITQLIIVKKAGDFQAEYIEGATVTVDGKACEELPDGLYSIEIEEGIEATVEVKAEGYKDKTEAFTTTSMASLLISLEPSIPEGESEQAFTLVDAEGNPIEGATITVGEESCVTDSEGKCVITAPIGEATTATITKPGYEDTEMAITPGEDGDEYSVTLPRAEEILTLPPGVKGDLDAGTVSDEIKDAFAAAGIPLSDEATIEKIDAGSWKVTDGEDVYSVLEEEGELNVYPGGGTPAPPGPPTPPGEPKWDFVEFDTWVDDSNKARIKYKGLDLISGTEYHGVFEVMFPPEVHAGTEINATTLAGSVDIDATMNEGKTVEIRLYEYVGGKPSKIIDRKDVAIPMRPVVDQVEVILGPEMLALWQQNPALKVHCDELIDYAWPFLAWFPPMFGFETRKGVTDGKAIFTVADGLVKDKQYIFHMYPQLALEEVLKGNAVKFGYTPSVTLTKTNIMEAAMCPFFGFEPGSVECENEVNEFVDAYYVANTIKKLVTGENLLGEPDTADMFDIIFMPIIMLGAAVPFIPVGKTLKTALGPIVNLIRKADKGAWLAKNQHKMHLALAAGKGATIDEAKKLMALGKWDEAEKLLDNVVTEIHNSPTLSATARENLAGWNAGARKLLDDNPQMKTKIDDLTDEAVDGTIFKTHFDEIVRHFDEAAAAGDLVKAKQIWKDGVAGNIDNLIFFDKNLAKASPDFQMMHNIMRFSKDEYIDALKKAGNFDIDLTFTFGIYDDAGNVIRRGDLVNRVEQYKGIFRVLDDDEIAPLLKLAEQRGAGLQLSYLTKLTKSQDVGEGFTKATNLGADLTKAEKAKDAGAVMDGYMAMFEKIKATMGEKAALDAMNAKLPEMMKKVGVIYEPKLGTREAMLNIFMGKKAQWLKNLPWPVKIGVGIFSVGTGFLFFNMVADIQLWGPGTTLHFWPAERHDIVKKALDEVGYDIRDMEDTIENARTFALAKKKDKAVAEFNKVKTQIYPEIRRKLGSANIPDPNPYCSGAFANIENCPKLILSCDSIYWKIRCNEGEMIIPYKQFDGIPLVSPLGHEYQPKLEGAYQKFLDDWTDLVAAADAAVEGLPTTISGPFGLDVWMETYGYEDTLAPAPPTFYATNPTETSMELVWSPSVPGAHYPCAIESYKIAVDGETVKQVPHVEGQTQYLTKLTGLEPNREYVFQLTAHDAYGISSAPRADVARTGAGLCPKPNAYFGAIGTTTIAAGDTISFDPTRSDPGAAAKYTALTWDFGDGSPVVVKFDETKVDHTFDKEGKWAVNLHIENDCGKSNDAPTVDVTVGELVGTIEFTRDVNDNLQGFAPEIWFKKEGEAEWEMRSDLGPSGTYPSKLEWAVGTYEIEYRYLGVTRCGKTVEVLADKETPFSCPLILYLPDQHVVEGVNDVRTTVTAVKDGDTIFTAFTDSLPPRPSGSQRVRMVGYDAPDMAILDSYATDMLKKLLPVDTPITLKIVSYNVLGRISRVLAGVIKDDGTDVNRKMIESCLVSEPEKTAYTKDLYFNWELEFSNYWGDPKSDRCLGSTDPTGKLYISLIVNTSEGTVQINNRWLPVYAIVRMFKGGQPIDKFTYYTHKHIATNETSPSYGYKEAQAVKLYVSSKEIDDKNTGFEIESDIIGEVPPDTYVVTFTSNPPGAKVSTIPGTITISRLTSVLKSQRYSTPISRFTKKQKFR